MAGGARLGLNGAAPACSPRVGGALGVYRSWGRRSFGDGGHRENFFLLCFGLFFLTLLARARSSRVGRLNCGREGTLRLARERQSPLHVEPAARP